MKRTYTWIGPADQGHGTYVRFTHCKKTNLAYAEFVVSDSLLTAVVAGAKETK